MLIAMYGHATPSGTQITALNLGGKGDVTDTHTLWTTKLPKDCVGSPVIADGRIYLATEHGFAICLDLATGEKKWEKRLAGTGAAPGCWSSLLCADDKIFISNQSGDVFVLKIRRSSKCWRQTPLAMRSCARCRLFPMGRFFCAPTVRFGAWVSRANSYAAFKCDEFVCQNVSDISCGDV